MLIGLTVNFASSTYMFKAGHQDDFNRPFLVSLLILIKYKIDNLNQKFLLITFYMYVFVGKGFFQTKTFPKHQSPCFKKETFCNGGYLFHEDAQIKQVTYYLIRLVSLKMKWYRKQ